MLFGNRFPDEWRYEDGTLRQFHYLENGILVLKENNNDFWYFRILTDNVGSVVRVIDSISRQETINGFILYDTL